MLQFAVGFDKLDRVRQRVRQRQIAANVLNVSAELNACLAQPGNVLFAKLWRVLRADTKRIRNPFEISDVAQDFTRGILRIDTLSLQIDT